MTSIKNDHGQPIIEYLRSNNREKLLHDLIGTCQGIVADSVLTTDEVAFLDAWLKESRGLLNNDADFIDLQDCIQDILADGIVTENELEDLHGLIDCIIRHRSSDMHFDCRDQAIDRLLGLSRGLVADRRLNDREIEFLQDWLRNCSQWLETWPFNILSRRIADALADGIVTDEERLDLIDTISSLVGGAFIDTGSPVGNATRAHESEGLHCDELHIQNRLFLFTGKFVYGTREKCEQLVVAAGGAIACSVNKKLHYLVVGTLSSRDWKHESFGRKIEQAMQLRAEGHPVAVISEEQWVKSLAAN